MKNNLELRHSPASLFTIFPCYSYCPLSNTALYYSLFQDCIPETPTRLKASSRKILNPIAFGYTNTLSTYQSDEYIKDALQKFNECNGLAC